MLITQKSDLLSFAARSVAVWLQGDETGLFRRPFNNVSSLSGAMRLLAQRDVSGAQVSFCLEGAYDHASAI